jgi:hypothetical protein
MNSVGKLSGLFTGSCLITARDGVARRDQSVAPTRKVSSIAAKKMQGDILYVPFLCCRRPQPILSSQPVEQR